jgi:zinc protease
MSQHTAVQSIAFEKVTLSNGLDVILHQDSSLPLVAVNVWYHVGSKDEEPGKTGFAHLFEHVMFEGSKHHNESYFEPLQKVGAGLNGSTTPDRTNYWENLPSNYLELALWLESDRMGFLLEALDQRRFDIQRDVVKNERRQSYENRPYGMAAFSLNAATYPLPHPYHWLTIGSQEDLDAASVEDAKAFFRRFYRPSNASLAVAGDFQRDQALRLVERYFGDLPSGTPSPMVARQASSLQGHVQLTLHDKVLLPRLYLVWPTVPRFDRDEAPLAVLGSILGDGRTSRLHRSLVYQRQIAQSATAYQDAGEIAGDFSVEVTAAAGHSAEEMEEAARAEVERLRTQLPTAEELARAKNRIQWQHVRRLEGIGGFGGRADRLNSYNVFARDPGALNTDFQRYLAVRGEDLQRAAQAYLGARCVRLFVLPEQTPGDAHP